MAPAASSTKKVLYRLLILALVLCLIYVVTVGREDFLRLVYTVVELFQKVHSNFLKK